MLALLPGWIAEFRVFVGCLNGSFDGLSVCLDLLTWWAFWVCWDVWALAGRLDGWLCLLAG
jgi:hypothetical protein